MAGLPLLRRLEALAQPRLLIVRNDGLGDLVLTLPLVAALKRALPRAHLTLLLAAPLAPLAPVLPDVDAVIADDGVLLKRHRGRFAPEERARRVAALTEEVRAGGFHAALLPYAEAASARLVQRAGVPLRIGPLRRAFFWRFNAFYHRSRRGSGAAEFALNLGYLECLGLPPDYVAPRVTLPPPPADTPTAGPYAVLHPHKRSGTALSWPLGRFVALAGQLRAAGLAVVVVGDGPDRPVLEAAFGTEAGCGTGSAGSSRVRMDGVRIETGLTLPQLVGLIGGARCFVGNSSGPLHLAGLTGTPHVALFPQDRVSAPERWRTLPAAAGPADWHDYLLAPRFPKDCLTCEGPRCPYHNCVASLEPAAVWQALRRWGVELPVTPPGG